MNANEKQAVERALKQARPTDVVFESVSSVSGSSGVRKAMKTVEASVTQHQKTGREMLLLVIRK